MRGNNFIQGKFNPMNPRRYHGDVNNIVFRSSWELAAFKFCDEEEGIVKWMSEETVVPYVSPVDSRPHRYFIDLTILVRMADGSLRKKYVEIKPYAQTIEPKKRSTERDEAYVERVRTYLVNQAKWAAAREWAARNNGDFIILTEREIFPQNHSIKPYRQPKQKVDKANKPAKPRKRVAK